MKTEDYILLGILGIAVLSGLKKKAPPTAPAPTPTPPPPIPIPPPIPPMPTPPPRPSPIYPTYAPPPTPPAPITPTMPIPEPEPPPTPLPATYEGMQPTEIPAELYDYLKQVVISEIENYNAQQEYYQINYSWSGSFLGEPADLNISVSGKDDWIILGTSGLQLTYQWANFILQEYIHAPIQPPTYEYMAQRVKAVIIDNILTNVNNFIKGKTLYNTKTFQLVTVS